MVLSMRVSFENQFHFVIFDTAVSSIPYCSIFILLSQMIKMGAMTKMHSKTLSMILITNHCKGLLSCVAEEVPAAHHILLSDVNQLVYISLQRQHWNY